ncbi:OmpA family protein [Sphaerotilus uruguayifluvii]|uniref:Outer membrane protein OmpA-like peptidoglycan-associated protein n=1 Tax=Sphaerotilus uruguayifluvii TaxID=2735897 RepID=A0ABX2G7W7_9BURK|nr:OmpA family protein [Leptothrix sp. C29]NRT57522.1 outer membrane protein OmpA-like peptidoglycan-associated protein [Leptothrix sp. C29]
MSDDDRDDSRKVGLWVVFASVAVLLLGVLGFAVTRTLKGPSAPAAQTAAAAASTGETDVLVDLNPTGPALAVLYFETGSAEVSPQDAGALAEVVKALAGDGSKRVLLSGYHDSTGDPAKNAELAKQRAKAVRAALIVGGVPLQQVLLRKPESTTGSGTDREARRVEIRIVDAP